jgi:predicted DCC family thiol-disulfide oxidoreductase YuxK
MTTNNSFPLTLLYDGACPVCSLEMDHLRERDAAGRLAFVDITAAGFDAAAYGTTLAELNRRIHAVRPDGSHLIGLAALREAYAAVGLGWVLRATGWTPFARLAEQGYEGFARHRQRISQAAAPWIHMLRAWRTARRMRRCQAGRCTLAPAANNAEGETL